MLISEAFPSKYLKSTDLKGKEARVIMSHCEIEEVGMKDGQPQHKPVLYFIGKEKGIVLNKTNANVISDFYGDDSDEWANQPLILFAVRTEFQGKATDGIRVRIPTAKDNKPSPGKTFPPDRISSAKLKPADPDPDLNDEIPY